MFLKLELQPFTCQALVHRHEEWQQKKKKAVHMQKSKKKKMEEQKLSQAASPRCHTNRCLRFLIVVFFSVACRIVYSVSSACYNTRHPLSTPGSLQLRCLCIQLGHLVMWPTIVDFPPPGRKKILNGVQERRVRRKKKWKSYLDELETTLWLHVNVVPCNNKCPHASSDLFCFWHQWRSSKNKRRCSVL